MTDINKLRQAQESIKEQIKQNINNFDIFNIDTGNNIINVTEDKLLTSNTKFYLDYFSQENSSYDTKISEMINNAILSYNSQKSINKPGTWSITIKDIFDNESDFLISPGDWVAISISQKRSNDINMLGMIDRVAQNKTIDNEGKVLYTWTISGRDFGRIFEDTYIYFCPYIADELTKKIAASGINMAIAEEQKSPQSNDVPLKSPEYFAQKYIDTILGGKESKKEMEKYVFNTQLPKRLYNLLDKSDTGGNGETSFYNVLKKTYLPCLGTAIYKDILGKVSYINLLNLIQDCLNLPFNEFIFDIIDGVPNFIFRPSAMPLQSYFNIVKKNHTFIHDNIITSMNLGLSDHERTNCFWLHANNQTMGLAFEYITMIEKLQMSPDAEMSIKKYGLKKAEFVSDFIYNYNNAKGILNSGVYGQMLGVLKEYFYNKHKFINGTITTQWYNNFKVGGWLRLDNPELFIKIEQIDTEWTYLSPIKNTLTLTHGFRTNGKFVDNINTIKANNINNRFNKASFIKTNIVEKTQKKEKSLPKITEGLIS